MIMKQEEVTMIRPTYTKSMTISVTPGQYEQVKKITDKEYVSMSSWVRNLIEAELTTKKEEETRK